MTEPGDVTLASYTSAVRAYIEHSCGPSESGIAYLDRVAALVGDGHVLELGSGAGWDADQLERSGVRVTRTDAVVEFVERQRAAGHEANVLDIRVDDFGGPYDAIVADAVLHHLSRRQFDEVLNRARQAVVPDGIVAFTLKEGVGDGWSHAKIGLPRHFTYWREPDVRSALARAGWSATSIVRVQGRSEPWLFVIACKARPADG